MPEHHTKEEINEAIETADMLYKRDGYLSSKTLLRELEARTGKPVKYWHTIELINAIKRARAGTQRKPENYRITKEHEQAILAAAEQIAYSQPVPKVSPEDIRQFYRNMDAEIKPKDPAAITHATSEKINAILKAAGWTQYKTGNYITSIPPARNADEIDIRAARILEAAQDPESGIGEKLHEIRYKHKYHGATPEEILAAALECYITAETPEDFKASDELREATLKTAEREIAHRIKRYRPQSRRAPTEYEITWQKIEAFTDLKAAREAAGKTLTPQEFDLYYFNITEIERHYQEEQQAAKTKRKNERHEED